MDDVLVLNASHEPLCVIDLGRAVTLVLSGRVVTLETTGRVLHSPSTSVAEPTVVRLGRFAVVPRHQAPVTKRAVLAVYGYLCAYCGRAKADSVDHVVPVSRSVGPPNVWSNVVAACQSTRRGKGCNGVKGDRLLSELGWPPVTPIVPTRVQVLAALHRGHPTWAPYLAA